MKHAHDRLSKMIEASLRAFVETITVEKWRSKERDCVNRYVHEFLMPQCGPGAPIADALQIGIEIGVPQPPGRGTRRGANKDVVIWPRPNMSAWDENWRPVNQPMALIEWKVRKKKLDDSDLDFVGRYAWWVPGFVGFVVTLDFPEPGPTLTGARFSGSTVELDWLRIGFR